jgi:hypothetical protein
VPVWKQILNNETMNSNNVFKFDCIYPQTKFVRYKTGHDIVYTSSICIS